MQKDADSQAPGLVGVLLRSRELGFLGPGDVDEQLAHSRAFGELVGPFAGEFLDLGAGGGLPGLVLLELWPSATGVLLDAQERRCQFLREAVEELGWEDRVEVRVGRAEMLGRDPELRGRFGLVVARGFGPPPVTAECAVGFLRPGGRLAVTEPPPDAAAESRWDAEGLARLGFGAASVRRSSRAGVAEMTLEDRSTSAGLDATEFPESAHSGSRAGYCSTWNRPRRRVESRRRCSTWNMLDPGPPLVEYGPPTSRSLGWSMADEHSDKRPRRRLFGRRRNDELEESAPEAPGEEPCRSSRLPAEDPGAARSPRTAERPRDRPDSPAAGHRARAGAGAQRPSPRPLSR